MQELALAARCKIQEGTHVDGNLDGDLTTVDNLSVHLLNGLLLHLLGAKVDEAETTSLAGLTASLELANHITGNGAQGNLGGLGAISSKEFLELLKVSTVHVNW